MFTTLQGPRTWIGGCCGGRSFFGIQSVDAPRPEAGRAGAWADAQGELLHTTADRDALDNLLDMDENDAQARGRVS